MKKHSFLLCLLVFFLLTRLPYVLDNSIPFAFDHGKDSLAILYMLLTFSPKLIGPWTSIPGLFFGPAWYYLLLPAYAVFGGHPVAPVAMMLVLVGIQIFLAYKYFGKWEALIVATSQAWITLSQSAWNPFPMALTSWIILLILKRVEVSQHLTIKQAALLGLSMSLGFHFSTAFAIFYPVLVGVSLLWKKIKFTWQHVLVAIGALVSGFLPQLLFELRNNFLQTKAIINYLKVGEESDPASLGKLWHIAQVGWGEIKLAILPTLYVQDSLKLLAQIVVAVILLWWGMKLVRSKKPYLWQDVVLWTVMPLIGFLFLHFNFWYLLGILPIWVMLVGQILRTAPKFVQIVVGILFVLTPLTKVAYYYQVDKPTLDKSRAFLPIKLETIAFIRETAGERRFASYHYVPDIYDFSYQYLYFWQAMQGEQLPTQFAYKPDAVEYITDKPELLAHFNHDGTQSPEVIFYVVEKAEKEQFLEEWWQTQKYSEIVNEHKISTEVTVYEATP